MTKWRRRWRELRHKRGCPLGLADRHVADQTSGCRTFVECSSWERPVAATAPVPGSLRIGAFSRKVGVSAAVLRAWESRYGLFDPDRTSGGGPRFRGGGGGGGPPGRALLPRGPGA